MPAEGIAAYAFVGLVFLILLGQCGEYVDGLCRRGTALVAVHGYFGNKGKGLSRKHMNRSSVLFDYEIQTAATCRASAILCAVIL